ncbi:BTAD domain-containing putative transcriptional regulator [Streptomyces qinzhouensis]|uniref:BTAD domain-containing putative transcriptional regulator n=1 Tax=Streptomyces qinzhouensis TaxID=2599401 RepID=UPI001FE2A974|nr:BTAD domain-containing putative transcriptional regulator [Streptomyces qinzhouensis]
MYGERDREGGAYGAVATGGIGFGILGEVTVWAGDGGAVRVPELKVRTLLAALLVDPGRPVAAHRLIDDLWGDETPGNPQRALQAKVSQLRRVLAEAVPGGRELLVSRAPGYQLVPGEGALDAAVFRTLAARARRTPDPAVRAGLLERALAVWRGPAFADFAGEPFARAAAARWEEERLLVVEDRAEARLALGDHAALAAELAEPVTAHPLRERLRAAQLRALYASGRQAEALDGYASLRRALSEGLGVDPGPELVALHTAMLRQDPALDTPRAVAPEIPAEPPADASGPSRALAPIGRLVGREAAVAEVAGLLASRRLVTLTGPGGVGKTRLALTVAARLGDRFPDGVRLVELAGAGGEPAEVVAAELGLRDDGVWGVRSPGPPAERLAAALSGRRMLLLLDNCEQVVDRAAALVELLLRRAPGLVVLTTSREPLALAPETLWPVPPLDPDAAVRLFVERASAGAPGFRLDDGNRSAVAAVVRRLDGLPLALELAATRVRTLGVHRLPGLLDDRFRVLRAGRRDAPARQRTLRAVIDWSWELLSEPERVVLRRLSPHPDGYTLEAAEAVCAGDGIDPADVLDLLAGLVDRSLVQMVGDGERYRLLESVAAYCLERLRESGEPAAVRTRHLDYGVRLAEAAAPRLHGPGQWEQLTALDAENGNLRWAVETAGAGGDTDRALRIATALTWYWVLRGRLGEARRTLSAVRELPGGAPVLRARALVAGTAVTIMAGDSGNRAALIAAALAETAAVGREPAECAEEMPDPELTRAHWLLGHALHGTGDLAAGEALTGPALDGFRSLGDRWGEAAALADRATQRLLRGALTAARADALRAAELFDEAGDACAKLWPVFPLTAVAEIHGDYATARRLREEGLATARRFGLSTQVPELLSGLGRIALLTGDFAAARDHHERALRAAAALDFRSGEINALIGLGLGARREGRPEAAERHLREVLDWHREVGLEGGNALILAELGFLAAEAGEVGEALRLQAEGYAAAVSTRDPRAVALALEGFADALAAAGRGESAALLLGCADAARTATGAPLAAAERGDVDRVTAAVRPVLGGGVFAAAFTRGALLTPEAALAAAGVVV